MIISTAQLHNRFKFIHKTQMLLVPTVKSNNSGTYFEIRLNLFQLKCKTVFQNQQRINKEKLHHMLKTTLEHRTSL